MTSPREARVTLVLDPIRESRDTNQNYSPATIVKKLKGWNFEFHRHINFFKENIKTAINDAFGKGSAEVLEATPAGNTVFLTDCLVEAVKNSLDSKANNFTVTVKDESEQVSFALMDDGPGFPETILDKYVDKTHIGLLKKQKNNSEKKRDSFGGKNKGLEGIVCATPHASVKLKNSPHKDKPGAIIEVTSPKITMDPLERFASDKTLYGKSPGVALDEGEGLAVDVDLTDWETNTLEEPTPVMLPSLQKLREITAGMNKIEDDSEEVAEFFKKSLTF